MSFPILSCLNKIECLSLNFSNKEIMIVGIAKIINAMKENSMSKVFSFTVDPILHGLPSMTHNGAAGTRSAV